MAHPDPVVLFLGDSLTAGYGLRSTDAFPARIQQRIHDVGLGYRCINAGVSGDTSAGGLLRLAAFLHMPLRVLVVALGANDILRLLPLAQLAGNLGQVVAQARERHPSVRVLLCGLRLPATVLHPAALAYAHQVHHLFDRLANELSVHYLPDLLAGVAGDPALNLPDRLHPNAAGHARMAETVWQPLRPLLLA